MHLVRDYLHAFRKICMDNWFSSPLLAKKLLERNTYCISTVRKNRKHMPVMKQKLKNGEVETFSCNDVLVERWKDKRDVTMLNSFIPHYMELVQTKNPKNTREKPKSVLSYNLNMGGIDQIDRAVKCYENQRKSTKWYKKVFYHHLDLTLYNAYMVWKLLNPNASLTYKKFILSIIKRIFELHPPFFPVRKQQVMNPCLRKTGQHFPNLNIKDGKTKYSDCLMCKLNGKRMQTKYKCDTCNIFLCISTNPSCFQKYHTLQTLPKVRIIINS